MPWDACGAYAYEGDESGVRLRWTEPADAVAAAGAVPIATPAAFWYRGAGYVDVLPDWTWRTAHGCTYGRFPLGARRRTAAAAAVRMAAAGAGAWDPAAATVRSVRSDGDGRGVVWDLEVPWRPVASVPADPDDWEAFAAQIPAHFEWLCAVNVLPEATHRDAATEELRGRFVLRLRGGTAIT